jgi:hypothetical protein
MKGEASGRFKPGHGAHLLPGALCARTSANKSQPCGRRMNALSASDLSHADPLIERLRRQSSSQRRFDHGQLLALRTHRPQCLVDTISCAVSYFKHIPTLPWDFIEGVYAGRGDWFDATNDIRGRAFNIAQTKLCDVDI